MNCEARSIILTDNSILVDVVWHQDSGHIFETKVLFYENDSVIDTLAFNLGVTCEIDASKIIDLRSSLV